MLWLEAAEDKAVWHLQEGKPLTVPMSAEEASSHHPGLVRLTRAQWVHHNRIRLTKERSLELDNGQEFLVAPSRHTHRLKETLGIPAFDHLAPDDHGLQLMGLRDYPFEIARASEALLYEHFRTPNSLLFNIMYQSFDIYQKTGVVPYGNTLSGYYYRPLQATLYRGGFMSETRFMAKAVSKKDKLYQLFLRLLHAMVYHHRIFTYEEFGFIDPYPEDRLIGSQRPHQILLVEKGDKIEDYAQQLQAEFGLTLHLLQGMPSLMTTEFFAKELKTRGLHRVQIFRYNTPCPTGPHFITRPELFTQEELDLFSRPLDPKDDRIDDWLLQSGGIQGKPRGIHADWLQPPERVFNAIRELLPGLEPTRSLRPYINKTADTPTVAAIPTSDFAAVFAEKQRMAREFIDATEDPIEKEVLGMAYSLMISGLLRNSKNTDQTFFEPVECFKLLKRMLQPKALLQGLLSGKYATLDEGCQDLG